MAAVAGLMAMRALSLASRGRQPTALPLDERAVVASLSAFDFDECMLSIQSASPHPVPGRLIQHDRATHAAHVTAMYRSMSRLAVDRCGAGTDIVFVAPRGGLADRFRGMVQLFYYALLSNRGFAMDWKQPYRLTEFFEVTTFARGGAAAAAHPPQPMEVTTDFFQDGHDIRADLPANASVAIRSANFRWGDIVRNPHLRPAAIRYGLIGMTRSQLFRLAVDVLILRPRPAVLSAADAVLAGMGMPLMQRSVYLEALHGRSSRGNASQAVAFGSVVVGVQIRTGAHGASWQSKDPPRHSLGTVACFAAEVVRDCRVWGKCYVVLTSDSEQAADLFKAHIDSIVGAGDDDDKSRAASAPDIRVGESPGEIMHVYRKEVDGRPPVPNEWLKTMVDWYLLRQADALVLSRSGFGWVAAWAGETVNVRQLALDPASDACAWYHLPPVSCHEDLYLGVGLKCSA